MKLFSGGAHKGAVVGARSPEIYPEDVRYSLRYRRGALDRGEIGQLYDRFPALGFYLTMKALDQDDDTQHTLLETVAGFSFQSTELTRELAATALNNIPNDQRANGYKLGEIARHGPTRWAESFEDAISDEVEGLAPESPVIILANASYVGLGAIARHTVYKDRRLGIVKPNRLDQSDKPIGFMIEPDTEQIVELASDFGATDAPPLFFDDVISTGSSMNTVLNYWSSQNDSMVPRIASVKNLAFRRNEELG